MSQRRKITRREFLSLSTMAAVGAVASACAPSPTEPPEPTQPAPPDTPVPEATAVPEAPPEPVSAYNEAPMLADLVASGELPPVDERLPKNPCV